MSNENRPVGSVGDASMSPRSSHTTNVLPSRIRIIWPAIVSPSACRRSAPRPSSSVRSAAGRAAGSGRGRPGRPRGSSSPRSADGHRVGPAAREVVEERPARREDAVGVGVGARHGDRSAADLHRQRSGCPLRSSSIRRAPLVRSRAGMRPRPGSCSRKEDVGSDITRTPYRGAETVPGERPGSRAARARAADGDLGTEGRRSWSGARSHRGSTRCRGLVSLPALPRHPDRSTRGLSRGVRYP